MPLVGEAKREYQKLWMKNRRAAWIKANGPCKSCGSSENLEIDHVDLSTKSVNPRDLWSRKKEVREVELSKCQVLCEKCHLEKTAKDLSWHEITHGSSGYNKRGCRCEVCVEYKRKANLSRKR